MHPMYSFRGLDMACRILVMDTFYPTQHDNLQRVLDYLRVRPVWGAKFTLCDI